MSKVEVRELSAETIDAQLTALTALSLPGPLREHEVTLSFRIDSEPEPMASAVFAQAMLGVREDLHFTVELPRRATIIRSLVRSGVASALARHGKSMTFQPAGHSFSAADFWHTWTPGAHAAMAPMFGAAAAGERLFGPDHALFINPHLTTEPEGDASVTPLVRRWLTRIVVPDLDQRRYRRAVVPPVFAVDQLLRNVREHALVPARHHGLDSLVGLEVVGSGRARKLRVTVLDTGAGVPRTLRPKLGLGPAEQTDPELLTALLAGELPGWDRGRGFGLASIAELVQHQPGASLDLWSGTTRIHVDAEVDAHAAAEVPGTVVNALFPLPAA